MTVLALACTCSHLLPLAPSRSLSLAAAPLWLPLSASPRRGLTRPFPPPAPLSLSVSLSSLHRVARSFLLFISFVHSFVHFFCSLARSFVRSFALRPFDRTHARSRSSGACAPPKKWADDAIDELLNDVQLLEESASDDTLLRFAQANVSRAVYATFHAAGKRTAHREALATSEREIGLPEELLESEAGRRLLVQAVHDPRAVARRVGALLPSLVRHARAALSRVADADDARAALGGLGDAHHVDEGLAGALRLALYGLVLASELFDCCMLDECIALCDEIRSVSFLFYSFL